MTSKWNDQRSNITNRREWIPHNLRNTWGRQVRTASNADQAARCGGRSLSVPRTPLSTQAECWWEPRLKATPRQELHSDPLTLWVMLCCPKQCFPLCPWPWLYLRSILSPVGHQGTRFSQSHQGIHASVTRRKEQILSNEFCEPPSVLYIVITSVILLRQWEILVKLSIHDILLLMTTVSISNPPSHHPQMIPLGTGRALGWVLYNKFIMS